MATFDTEKESTFSLDEMSIGMQAGLKTTDTDDDGTLWLDERVTMHAAHTRTMTVRTTQMVTRW